MFKSRFQAGTQLATKLQQYAESETRLLAIPRGGIEVGNPIALSLQLPLDVIVPRKIPCPNNPELAIGAVTIDGEIELDGKLVAELGLSEADVQELIQGVKREIEHRLRVYCCGRARPQLTGRPVILIDDGLATGHTMIAGIKSVLEESPSHVIVAVPVSPQSTYERVGQLVDDMVVLHIARDSVFAVSAFYDNFRDLRDDELVHLLEECNGRFPQSIGANG
jgi:putative phosphoribosyl transferase